MTNEDIVAAILEHEGGFVNRIEDAGGATKYGVTQATLSRWLGRPASVEEVRDLSIDVARRICFKDYVERPGFLTLGDWRVRYAVADAAYNSGPGRAVKLLQRAVGATEDGRLGVNTIGRANTREPRAVALGVCCERNVFLARWAAGDLDDKDRDGVPDNLELLPGIVARVGRIILRVAQ